MVTVLAMADVEAVMVSLPPSILYAKSQTRQAKYQVNAAADSTARTMARMDADMNQYIRRTVGLLGLSPVTLYTTNKQDHVTTNG